jgi:hypothetical protein
MAGGDENYPLSAYDTRVGSVSGVPSVKELRALYTAIALAAQDGTCWLLLSGEQDR